MLTCECGHLFEMLHFFLTCGAYRWAESPWLLVAVSAWRVGGLEPAGQERA